MTANRTLLPSSAAPSKAARGFSVLELTISLAVTVIILLAVLQIFDFSSRLSRVQSNVADMQQAQRIVHYELTRQVRMTGRGGLPTGNLPAGQAIAVRDNVAGNTPIGGLGTPTVVEGSDVLTIRGNFTGNIYSVNYQDQATPAFTYTPATGLGFLRVDAQFGVITQSLQALIDAINGHPPTDPPRSEALLLVSARNTNVYVAVELLPGASTINLTPAPPASPFVRLAFRFATAPTATATTVAYGAFSSAGPGVFPDIPTVSRVSILEEYRYYLREERSIPGDNTSELVRRLSRTRTYPGTNFSYPDPVALPTSQAWKEDLVDNVLDLQFALGVNTANGCLMTPGDDPNCAMTETANGLNDDWLYNDNQPIVAGAWDNSDLYYVRMSTLVRTDKRDNSYTAPTIEKIENHSYSTLSANTSTQDRMFRRRVLQTVIDLRNL